MSGSNLYIFGVILISLVGWLTSLYCISNIRRSQLASYWAREYWREHKALKVAVLALLVSVFTTHGVFALAMAVQWLIR